MRTTTAPITLPERLDVHRLTGVVGYRVLGRQGELGRVVDLESCQDAPESSTIVVRGGATDKLIFHLPVSCLIGVSHESGTVGADVDIADFIASFGLGGIVELRLASTGPTAETADGTCGRHD